MYNIQSQSTYFAQTSFASTTSGGLIARDGGGFTDLLSGFQSTTTIIQSTTSLTRVSATGNCGASVQALRYSVSIREIMFSYGACGFGDEPGVDDLQQKADDSIAAAESAFSAFLKDNNIIASPPLVLNLGEGGRLEVGGNHPDAQRVEDMLNAGTTDTNLKKQLREAIELKQHEAMVKLHNVYIHQFDDAMTLQGNTAAQAVNTQFQSITATAQFRFVQSFSGLAMQVSHESLGQWLENARKALAQTVAQARGSLAEPEQKQAAAA